MAEGDDNRAQDPAEIRSRPIQTEEDRHHDEILRDDFDKRRGDPAAAPKAHGGWPEHLGRKEQQRVGQKRVAEAGHLRRAIAAAMKHVTARRWKRLG